VTTPYFFNKLAGFLSLQPHWRVLPRKRDQTRETRAIGDQEIASASVLMAGLSVLASAKDLQNRNLKKADQNWPGLIDKYGK